MKTPVSPPLEELRHLGLRFRRPRVYIIDDELAVLELLTGYLEGEEFQIRTFTNAFDGLNAIAKHKPEVALVDLKMPGLHGLDLVSEGQRKSPATSFVVITGFTTVDTLLDAIRHGVRDYLTKPFSSADGVRLVVRNAVKAHGLELQLLMQSTVAGSILRLGELSSVGEAREEFFSLVRDIFLKLLDAHVVVALYRDKGRLVCRGDALTPVAPTGAEFLLQGALEQMGLEADPADLDYRIRPRHADTTSRFRDAFGTILPVPIMAPDGIECQLVVAHADSEAFSEEAVHTALSLAHNVGIIVQRQILGASHEHQMIVDLLHHLKDGVVVLDRQFRIRYVNPTARQILGLAEEAPLQQALEALSAVDPSLAATGRHSSFMSSLQKQVAARVGDEERFFDVEAYAFYTPNKVAYRMILFRDVTHMKREKTKIERLNKRLNALNEELRERNRRLETVIKELDSFAYIASHDLQEPFRHIEIFAQFLERDLTAEMELPSGIRYHLDQIEANVDIAKRLLADLRMLSKLTRMRNPYREVELVELVEEVLERFTSTFDEGGVKVVVDELPQTTCDPLKLKEVFHNLIGNACKYTESKEPLIEISAERDEEKTTVSVRDNGIGIDPEYHEYIFQPCRRIPRGGDTKGSGLGLAIVKKIVEEHGGRIWVESAPGEGATFRFTLPHRQPD